ncbi:MAG: hypothetical protein ACYSXF_03960 [Planctomycetota bacterium]|jgi:hypothetical protein
MSGGDHIVSVTHEPAPLPSTPRASADAAVAEARRLYRKTLATWVIDLLTLRRGGRDVPGLAQAKPPLEHDEQWSEAA